MNHHTSPWPTTSYPYRLYMSRNLRTAQHIITNRYEAPGNHTSRGRLNHSAMQFARSLPEAFTVFRLGHQSHSRSLPIYYVKRVTEAHHSASQVMATHRRSDHYITTSHSRSADFVVSFRLQFIYCVCDVFGFSVVGSEGRKEERMTTERASERASQRAKPASQPVSKPAKQGSKFLG